MSGAADITCEACRDALTELVCDELSTTDRERVLAHARGCLDCARELRRLSSIMGVAERMPLETPSPTLRANVLDAARGALMAAGPAPDDRPAGGGGLRAWLARVGDWAMAPQVAMACVLLLMVGIGLYTLPLSSPDSPVALRATEAAPAAQAVSLPADAPRAAPDAPAESPAQRYAPEPRVSSGADVVLGPRSEPMEQAPVVAPARRKAASDSRTGLAGVGTKTTARPSNGAAFEGDDFAPPPPAPAAEAKSMEREESSAPSPAASGGAGRAADVAGAAEKATATAPSTALEQGVRLALSGRYADAVKLLQMARAGTTGTERAKASLWLAKSYRGLGDCAAALKLYEPIVASKAVDAITLREAADCYEKMGDAKRALALRDRAAQSRAKAAAKAAPSGAYPASADPY